MLIPIAYDVPMSRWPWMNWALMALCVVMHVWALGHEEEAAQFILGIDKIAPELGIKQHPLAWVMHMFLHADFMHLGSNMLFMWVFGNAACAKLGQLGYLGVWIGAGLLSALIQPYGLGASGAINGAVGFCLVFYPLNDITIAYWIFVRGGLFALSSAWMILLWFGFDVLGAVGGGGAVAFLSHIVGFGFGAATAIALLTLKVLEADDHERTLLDLVADSRGGGLSSQRPGPTQRGRAAPIAPQVRLHVRLPSGATKHLTVDEFLRHEAQGKPVDQFPVSEDGDEWTTFGAWRTTKRV